MTAFMVGPWRADSATRRISAEGRSTRVSRKAMDVLATLVDADGGVVERDALLETVWPDVVVGEEVLTHAIAELRRALEDDARKPLYIETVHRSGYRLLSAERPDPAPTDAERAIDQRALLYCLQGRTLFDLGGQANVREALELFEQAVALEPTFAAGQADLAKAQLFCGLYYDCPESAILVGAETAATAVRINPRSPTAHAALGLAYASAGKCDAALAHFGTAIQVGEESFQAYYLYGRACFASGDWSMAAAVLEQAARLRSEDFQALALAAKAWRALGKPEAAQRANRGARARIEQGLAITEDSLRARACLAGVLVDLGEIEPGLAIASGLRETADPMTYYLIGAFARAGLVEDALNCLDGVIGSGWSHGAWLRVDPDLDQIRSHPRFQRRQAALELH